MEEKNLQQELDALDAEVQKQAIEADAEMHAMAERLRIKASDHYDEPEYTLSQNGRGFAPLGNIMALMAEMKHGKTFVNMSFAAALLHGNYLGLKAEMKDARVLFFDTEQDLADGQRIQRRVHFVCGWDFEVDNDRFQVFHLREIPFDQRRKFIDWAVRAYKPTSVFVDGVRDLLQDFNSLEESANLIQWLMTLSSESHCAIWTVLHVNPNSDKMRGHLGTELGNKVTDVFRVVKKKEGCTVKFVVDHVAARHRDVDGWTFEIDDEKPYGIPVLSDGQGEEVEQMEATDDLYDLMLSIIGDPGSVTTRQLLDGIREKRGVGQSKAYKYINQAVEEGIIKKSPAGRYNMKPKPAKQEQPLPDDFNPFA